MLSHMCLSVNKKAVPKKEVLLCGVPKSLKLVLSRDYELSHGLFVTGLSSYMNDGYIKAYFQQWGNVISCKVKKIPNCGKNSAVALVKYSSEDEADKAHWFGTHVIGGLEVVLKQFVCQKTEEDFVDETAASEKPRPMRSMGLGYILEDPQWLENEDDQMETAAMKTAT
uniref:RRM domain-containing protein n=1 Tax=Oryzias latipes TaxID=8090 RepID=A0A3B3ILK6_ORYLA